VSTGLLRPSGPERLGTGGLHDRRRVPEAGKLTLVRDTRADNGKDVREFIRRLEAVGLAVESTPGTTP
jgi:hypothetical protein